VLSLLLCVQIMLAQKLKDPLKQLQVCHNSDGAAKCLLYVSKYAAAVSSSTCIQHITRVAAVRCL
jgi:hypothetical protein